MIGASNAVNLTDGLDGLAMGPVSWPLSPSQAVLRAGHAKFTEYLNILMLKGSGELTVFCVALWGRASASCGSTATRPKCSWATSGRWPSAARSARWPCCQKELLLPFIGGLFVTEALSVILQVASFRLTGRRIFRMAPLHHHFELAGWAESKIVIRF